MHKILIKAVGKPTESWQREAIEMYLQRLQSFVKIDLTEMEERHGGSAKPDETKTKKLEAERLLKSIPNDAFVIALDEQGKNISSNEFASKLNDWTDGGRTVVVLIGGSWGLDVKIRERANVTLSFGKQTLPHLLARIVLLEQLYRAETILRGKMYHK